MPLVIAQPVKRLFVYYDFSATLRKIRFLLDCNEVAKKYKHMCTDGTKLRAYVSRVLNEEYNVVSEPRVFSLLRLILASRYTEQVIDGYQQATGYYLDLDEIANELSIPDGYFVEVLLTSFVNQQIGEKVIFPYETRVHSVKELQKSVEEHIEALGKIGSISQSHSFLSELGLKDIASDLSEGYARFESGDYDGAIKAYRKVVEGFRNYLDKKEEKEGKKVYKGLIDNSESRTEKTLDFLNKTYSLLSNFGEHYGTHAFDEEGIFTHKLVENLTEYLTKKLRQFKEP